MTPIAGKCNVLDDNKERIKYFFLVFPLSLSTIVCD